jgi:hypothetical protein
MKPVNIWKSPVTSIPTTLDHQLMKDYEQASGDTLASPIVQEFVDTEDVVRQTKQEKPFFIQGKEETDDLETVYDIEDSL